MSKNDHPRQRIIETTPKMSTSTVRPLNFSPIDRVLDQLFFLLSNTNRCIRLYTFLRSNLNVIEADVPVEEITKITRVLQSRNLSEKEEEVVCSYLKQKYIDS